MFFNNIWLGVKCLPFFFNEHFFLQGAMKAKVGSSSSTWRKSLIPHSEKASAVLSIFYGFFVVLLAVVFKVSEKTWTPLNKTIVRLNKMFGICFYFCFLCVAFIFILTIFILLSFSYIFPGKRRRR